MIPCSSPQRICTDDPCNLNLSRGDVVKGTKTWRGRREGAKSCQVKAKTTTESLMPVRAFEEQKEVSVAGLRRKVRKDEDGEVSRSQIM